MSETNCQIQLVIPMAGDGLRFQEAGYTQIKPLLDIHGVPMFLIVLANLLDDYVGRVVLVVKESMHLGELVSEVVGNSDLEIELIELGSLTRGPAATVTNAMFHLDPELPVVVANSDQFVEVKVHEFYRMSCQEGLDAALMVMQDNDPKWSYVRLDETGAVAEVREKEVISKMATVGIYSFSSAFLMQTALLDMWRSQTTVNGEFYIAPAYNSLIERRSRIGVLDVGPISESVHGLGIPVDYETFLESSASRRAAANARQVFGSRLLDRLT